ncbi:hypothetical protein IFM89_027626 [Coptis chinensis]|uniref:Uncharacterized protein n=1 Tax=Coptis chinensis TaxID=261450 RepID=A0A835M9V2_9MAGN|nr:hypothetical protein IFM89_027626 [Coptis chinensis]
MMFGSWRLLQTPSILGKKSVKKKRKIIVGLKNDNFSRETLLRLLTLVVASGDQVLAVHVEESTDSFDLNTFHIHEDICKSKQVDFQVKVCTGDTFVTVLIHQVRLHHATILVIGCHSPRTPSYLLIYGDGPQRKTPTSKAGDVVVVCLMQYPIPTKLVVSLPGYSARGVGASGTYNWEQANKDTVANHESLAKSLLSCGLCENLIDPHLNEDYDKEEMERMIMAARLCLMHSSSRRPTMKTVCNFSVYTSFAAQSSNSKVPSSSFQHPFEITIDQKSG